MNYLPLVPFSATAPARDYRVLAGLVREENGFRLGFRIEPENPAAAEALRLPAGAGPGARKDGLWRSTCFEAFFGVKDSPAYFEFNASPAGDWAWYAFSAYRQGMQAPEVPPPERIRESRANGRYEAEWRLPAEWFGAAIPECAGLTAVLDRAGEIGYRALGHAGAEPDFHLRKSFAIRL